MLVTTQVTQRGPNPAFLLQLLPEVTAKPTLYKNSYAENYERNFEPRHKANEVFTRVLHLKHAQARSLLFKPLPPPAAVPKPQPTSYTVLEHPRKHLHEPQWGNRHCFTN